MAKRKIVKIDEELCTGCGDCVPSCAEGAIRIIDGKAKLMADNLCDGLGACIGDCPEGAITIEERDADEFDELAVEQHLEKMDGEGDSPSPGSAGPKLFSPAPPLEERAIPCGCPSAAVQQFEEKSPCGPCGSDAPQPSELAQWPVQLHLLPPTAPFFKNADVLLAADCCAFTLGDFHQTYLKGKALAIACPKLDHGLDVYLEKLVAMIDQAQINTLTVMVMEVPCCSGLTQLAQVAVEQAQRKVPIQKITVGIRGDILGKEWL